MTSIHKSPKGERSEFRREIEDEIAGFELPRSREDFTIETDRSGCTDTTTVWWSIDAESLPDSLAGLGVEFVHELQGITVDQYGEDRLIRESIDYIVDLYVDEKELINRIHNRVAESHNQDDNSTYAGYDDGPSGWTTDFDVEATNNGDSQ